MLYAIVKFCKHFSSQSSNSCRSNYIVCRL